MTNYTIDGSVYNYPFNNTQPNINELDIYYMDVKYLYDLLFKKQDRYNKQTGCKHYYLLQDDIKLTMEYLGQHKKGYTVPSSITPEENKEIDWSKAIIDSRINDIKTTLGKLFRNLGYTENNNIVQYAEDEITEHIKIDSWFDIEDVTFKPDKQLLLPDDILLKIQDQNQRENTKKNLAIIAALNRYVYQGNMTHNLIMSKSITTKVIPLKDTGFDITMKQGDHKINDESSFHYKIKNLPVKNIHIDDQKINVSSIHELIKDSNIMHSISEAYEEAKKCFKDQIEFGLEVNDSIKQYEQKIAVMSSTCSPDERKKIKNWLKICPDILYENIKTLSNSVSSMGTNIENRNLDERWHCCRGKRINGNKCDKNACPEISCIDKCDFLETCGSYIHFFGADCIDDHRNNFNTSINTTFMIKDRTRKNSQGVDSVYWHHIRINTISCDDNLWFLTLRIYFKQFSNNKIEIGWIGRHLYNRCRYCNDLPTLRNECKRRDSCSRNPDPKRENLKICEYGDFLKEMAIK